MFLAALPAIYLPLIFWWLPYNQCHIIAPTTSPIIGLMENPLTNPITGTMIDPVTSNQALMRVSLSREKSRVEKEISLSISKNAYFNFSFWSRFSRFRKMNIFISLSTLDFWEWQETILFLLSIFESGKTNFSFYSRFSRVARQISLSTLDFFLSFWEFKSRVQHHL